MRAGAPQDQDGPTDAIRGAALITAGEDRSLAEMGQIIMLGGMVGNRSPEAGMAYLEKQRDSY